MFNAMFEWWVKKSIPVIMRLSKSQFDLLGTTRARTLGSILNPETVDEPYRVHAWVHGAIESVSMNISQTPLMWKNSRDKKAADRGDAGKWMALFEKPNEDMGHQQLFEATIVYLLHFGECMWVLDRDEPTQLPREIQPFDGTIFEAVTNSNDKLIGWKVKAKKNGREVEIPYAKWEVCHFKLFNPYDPIRGLAPLDAAQLGIDQDFLASHYNKAFFSNSALPGGVIEVEEDLTTEQFNRMVQQFKDHHQGVSKAHTLALLEGGATYKQLAISQKDMEFLNQKKWNRDEVLAAFKVPKLELGIWDQVNFAVAKVQAREFWVKTLVPKMKLMEWIMWSQLFSVTGAGNIYAEFDVSDIDALQGDLVEKIEMMFKLWQMGYPANVLAKRFKINLDEIPNGTAAYVMANVNQVDATGKITVAAAPQNSGGNNANPKAK